MYSKCTKEVVVFRLNQFNTIISGFCVGEQLHSKQKYFVPEIIVPVLSYFIHTLADIMVTMGDPGETRC